MADDDAEITLNNHSTFALVQPFEAKTTSDNTSTSTSTVDIKPLSQTSTTNNTQTLDVKPLAQTVGNTIDVKPLNVNSRQELAVTEPIRTDASSTLDLKPLVIDVCSRTGQASLPPTHVCQPYQHRIGFTILGMEVFGMTLSGDNQTIVTDRPGAPSVVWGPVQSVSSGPAHHHRDHDPPWRDVSDGAAGGLRIRLVE